MGTYSCCLYSGEFKTNKMKVCIFMLVCFATVCFSISFENVRPDQIDLEDYEDDFLSDFENEDDESMMSDDFRYRYRKYRAPRYGPIHSGNYCETHKNQCWQKIMKWKCPITCKGYEPIHSNYCETHKNQCWQKIMEWKCPI